MEMWLLMFKCRLRTFCSPFYKVGKACPDSCRIGIIATSESPQKQSINNIQLPIRSSVFNLSYVHIMQFMEMWLLMFKCRLRNFCSPFYWGWGFLVIYTTRSRLMAIFRLFFSLNDSRR